MGWFDEECSDCAFFPNGNPIKYAFDKISEHHFQQTGEKIPGRELMWDIVNRACSGYKFCTECAKPIVDCRCGRSDAHVQM